ncbi:MAG: phosphate ABC transporter substrate-binding protein [Motiliproteus sp.]
MKKLFAGAVALVSLTVTSTVMANETITVTGSNSMSSLMEVLAETYTVKTGNFVEVQGPGSSAGIRAANEGVSMLGMASRIVQDDEIKENVHTVAMARDAIAVAVNPANGVSNLSVEQVADIYRGEITNWADVGGAKSPIVVITRDSASGTRAGFESTLGLTRKINGIKVSAIYPRAQVANGNGMVKTTVAHNVYAIGYISLGTVDESVQALSINDVAPSVATIQTGEYPIARPFTLLYRDDAPAAAMAYMNWILSDEGQAIVARKGYVPVK